MSTIVSHTRALSGATAITMMGRIAPTPKLAAATIAACTGLASASGSMPSSSRACTASWSYSESSVATAWARSWLIPRRS